MHTMTPPISSGLTALSHGNIEKARSDFQIQWDNGSFGGLEGLLHVASLTLDEELTQELLSKLSKINAELPSSLLLRAAFDTLRLQDTPDSFSGFVDAACGLRDSPKATDDEKFFASQICATRALRKSTQHLNHIAKPANTSYRLPLSLFSGIPIVDISINGSEPLPFILDTGAPGMLVTKQTAQRFNLKEVPHTDFQALALEDKIETQYTLMDIKLGGLEIKSAHAIVLELPVDTIAGVMSPQLLLEDFRVELDFENYQMALHPKSKSRDSQSLVTLPLIIGGGCPLAFARPNDRLLPRPLMLDTGANVTKLGDKFIADIDSSASKQSKLDQGAGNVSRQTRTLEEKLKLTIERIQWDLPSPQIYENKDVPFRDLRHLGLLGMDFFNGRRLVMDKEQKTLQLSERAKIPEWSPGMKADFEVSGAIVKEPVLVSETIKEIGEGSATIEILIQTPTEKNKFEIDVPNNWISRGQWLITRSVLNARQAQDDGSSRPLSAQELQGLWMKAFAPFSTDNTPPKFKSLTAKLNDRDVHCGEMSLAARSGNTAATLSIIECPSEPWRTAEIKLQTNGNLLWRFQRKGFEQAK